MLIKYTHRILFKAIALAIVCLFLVNDIAFGESALAPTLATKPICEIVRKPDGSFDVVTNADVIESWDRETVRSYKQGVEASGKAFRNRWALMDVGYIIGQMLILTQEHKLQDPKDILIPLIKKHIRNRAGEAEILLEEYNIDGIEEVREGNEIKGFSLPVTRSSTLSYKLVYNLQSGDTSIPIKDGKTVYIRVEKVASRQEMETIERVEVALRSMSPHASIEMDIFEFFSAVVMIVDSLTESPSSSIEPMRQQQQHRIAIRGVFEGLRNLVNKGKMMAREGRLTIVEAENYTAQIQEMLMTLEKEREDIYALIQQEKQMDAETQKVCAALHEPFDQIIDILRSRIGLIHNIRSSDSFTMDKLIQEATRGLVREEFITFRSDLPALLNIRGNRLSLINALANIIQNGASFAEEKQGDAAKVTITLSKENDLIKIDIGDNGDGIPPELLEIDTTTGRPRLFNLNVSEREGGTGLGTTEAWYAIKDMGGTISVRSDIGRGTKFTILLPDTETKKIEEIDKSSIADIFPKADYLTYLIIYMTGGAIVAPDREAKEVGEALVSLHKRLDEGLESEFIRRQGSPPLDVRDFYLWYVQLIKNDLGTAKELLSLVQYPRHKRNMAGGVPAAEIFVNGIEMLLDGSEKQIDINDTLEKILELTFSQYYRNRDYNYAISKEFSSDIPVISARQDKLAYLFFSLVLSLREMRKADLAVSTGITYDKGIKYITITMAAAQEIPLSNITIDKKDTGIGFELAKGIAQSYGGTIDVRSGAGKGTTFTVRLPIAKSEETTPLLLFGGKVQLTALSPEIRQELRTLTADVTTNFDEDTFVERVGLIVGTMNENGVYNVTKLLPITEFEPNSTPEYRVLSKKQVKEMIDTKLSPDEQVLGLYHNHSYLRLLSGQRPGPSKEDRIGNDLNIPGYEGRIVSDRLGFVIEPAVDTSNMTMEDIANFDPAASDAMLYGYITPNREGVTGEIESLGKKSIAQIEAAETGISSISVSGATKESERTHAISLQDALTYIQTQSQSQPLIIALGTSWIKGYEKGRYLQYDALNPLIVSLRTYCESKGIPFIVDADDKLLAQINAGRAKDGMSGAKVVVLAGESTVKSDEFAGLRADEKNAFVAGVNNQELTTDSYIRLLEMLTIALKLSAGLEISLDNAHIAITKDNERHIYIFLPHADPMDYERLKVIYEVQKFA